MTKKGKYPMYALAIVAGVAMAVWAGLPLPFLIVLLCPAMFFMMRRMGGMTGGQRGNGSSSENDAAAKRLETDGSHERIS